jgi:hypothetical protein
MGRGTRAVGEGIGHGVMSGGAAIGQGVVAARDMAASGLRAASDTVASTASRASEGVRQAADSVVDVMRFDTPVRETAADMAAYVPEAGRRVQSSLSAAFSDHPLLLGALGMAIGAGIAAAFPATETEQRLMGDASVGAQEGAKALWKSAKRKTGEMAQRGMDAAKDEGLTPAAGRDAARDTLARAARVVERAEDRAVERLRGG